MEDYKLTIVNLRGTSGCGKTSIVKNVLSHGSWSKSVDERGKIMGYYNLEKRWAVIGSYENVCGGCDTIRSQDEIAKRIVMYIYAGYNVLFEGLLTSTLTSRWERFAKSISDRANMLFWYVDTPIDECIKRIEKRRAERGAKTPFNPENTTNRVKAIDATYKKLSAAGCYCLRSSQDEIMKNMADWWGL